MNSGSAIVIGSGIAGLAAAIRLSVTGYKVTVFEKNGRSGGKLGQINYKGYRFDTGPSLFTEPEYVEALFQLAGEPIESYLQYQQLTSSCKYFFANGKIVHTWANRQQLLEELETQIGEPADRVEAYLDQSARLYNEVASIFLNHPITHFKTWKQPRVLEALTSVKPSFLFQTLNQYHESVFKTGEAIQLFNRFATYNGSNPYKTPALFTVIPHVELNKGVYFPSGGMISIVEALTNLAVKKGVSFEYNTPVQRIIQNGEDIIGVVVKKRNIFADVVVCNTDIGYAYSHLLRRPRDVERVQKPERSSSAIVFLWGIKKQFPQLDLHNILFSGDYIHEFQHLFHFKKPFKDPTVYINITSKMEAGLAPEGRENWFVMINAPSTTGLNWQEEIPFIRQQLLKKLRGTLKEDIEPLIEVEHILDPVSLQSQYHSAGGAIYGAASHSRMAAFRRPANTSRKIPGLYFCGGTVHPGGGIPLCLKSAQIVQELIQERAKMLHHS